MKPMRNFISENDNISIKDEQDSVGVLYITKKTAYNSFQ